MKNEQVCPECQNTNGEHKLWCSKTVPRGWIEPIEIELVPTRWSFEGERFYYQVTLYMGNYSIVRVKSGDPFIAPCMQKYTANGWYPVLTSNVENIKIGSLELAKQIIQDSELK